MKKKTKKENYDFLHKIVGEEAPNENEHQQKYDTRIWKKIVSISMC